LKGRLKVLQRWKKTMEKKKFAAIVFGLDLKASFSGGILVCWF